MFKNRGFASLALIIITLLVLGGGYWVWQNQFGSEVSKLAPPSADTNIEPPVTPSTPSVDMSDWKTYRNEVHRFEFRYPPDYILKVKVSASEIPPGFSDVQSSRDVRIFSDESTKILTFGVDVKESISGDLVDDNDFGSNENLYDFAFYGNSDLFRKILSTFRFTK